MKSIKTICISLTMLLMGVLSTASCSVSSMGEYEHKGEILYWVNAAPLLGGLYAGSADGSSPSKKVMFNPFSPDAIEIDVAEKTLYFTNMTLLDDDDGSVMSAKIVGNELSEFQTVVPEGVGLKTPKQIVLSKKHHDLYFADREGQRVYRVPKTGMKIGTDLEILVDFTDAPVDQHQFVGVAIDDVNGLFYWTDRFTNTIWRASINLDAPITPSSIHQKATKVLSYKEGMLIELDIDPINNHLYFTDRGEGNEFIGETLPAGFVGRVDLNDLAQGFEVVVPNLLKDPVGLSVSPETGYLYYSTSEDCWVFRLALKGGKPEQIHKGRPFCEGMKIVNWDSAH